MIATEIVLGTGLGGILVLILLVLLIVFIAKRI